MCVYGEHMYIHDLRSRLQTIKNWRWGMIEAHVSMHMYTHLWCVYTSVVCIHVCGVYTRLWCVCLFMMRNQLTKFPRLKPDLDIIYRVTRYTGCVREPLTPRYYQQGTNFCFPLSLFFVFRYISSTSILARASLSLTPWNLFCTRERYLS